MSRHEGVSCDACMKANFRGRRYKCLICYDYDLCSICYESGSTTNQHTAEHPMQCILTRHDFDIFHGGEPLSADHPQSLTCPFCGKMGHTESTLQEHVLANHTDVSYEVVCPICASVIGGDPNHITDDFADHLAVDHQTVNNPSEGNSRHGMRRMPHQGRGINRGVSRQSMRFGDSMDPIAELLSQLSGVRRSTAGELTSSIHLHQEARMRRQMQLYRMESSSNSTSGFTPTGGGGGTSTVAKSQNNTGTATSGEVTGQPAAPVQGGGQSAAGPGHGATAGGNAVPPNVVPSSSSSYSTQANAVSGAGSQQAVASAAAGKTIAGAPSFLLSRLVELENGEDGGAAGNVTSCGEKSIFLQELLLSTLADRSAETQRPVDQLIASLQLADGRALHAADASADCPPAAAAEAATQTDHHTSAVVVVTTTSPTSGGGGGFPMSKASFAHSVMKVGKNSLKSVRSGPNTPSSRGGEPPPPMAPALSVAHPRIVTGSGTVSVPPPPPARGPGGREPVSPGVNRRKPVRGDGRAHPPPN